MQQPPNTISVRPTREADLPFIQSLSPVLAAGGRFSWHSEAAIQKFQDDYIADMLAETTIRHCTLVAEKNGIAAGFIHVRESTDEISGESSATVPLLAVADKAQGAGVGKFLMNAAEAWAKEQGFRLLHLEVFSTNAQALGFYQKNGFEQETINMIKPLS